MAENRALYSSRKDAPNGTSRYDVRGTKYEGEKMSENTQNVGARHASPVNDNNAAAPAIRNSSFVIRNSESAKRATLYKPYDNYEAIEVPRIEYIPSDYYGRMGVPITILPYIIHPQNRYEGESDELRVTSAKTTESLIRTSYLEPRTSEREAPLAAHALNLAEVSEFGYVHSRAVRINDKRDRQYRGAVIDGKMCFSRIIIQRIDSLQEEANQKSKIKNQKSKIKNQKSKIKYK